MYPDLVNKISLSCGTGKRGHGGHQQVPLRPQPRGQGADRQVLIAVHRERVTTTTERRRKKD